MRLVDFFYASLNPPMRALLRSPFHGVASGNLCLLKYAGRKSGRAFATPLSYVRTGRTVRVLSSYKTRWWTNFREDAYPVEVEIARVSHSGTAIRLMDDPPRIQRAVREFLTALPRDAQVYGIHLDREKRPLEADLERAHEHVVVVEIELDASPH